jgi:hypothetical protein
MNLYKDYFVCRRRIGDFGGFGGFGEFDDDRGTVCNFLYRVAQSAVVQFFVH